VIKTRVVNLLYDWLKTYREDFTPAMLHTLRLKVINELPGPQAALLECLYAGKREGEEREEKRGIGRREGDGGKGQERGEGQANVGSF
jgi:hypothetical protein